MTEQPSDIDSLLQIVRELYEKRLPFNRLLGLKVEEISTTGACLKFPMKEELIGNYVHGNLHGGAISAVMDATGGITATASAVGKMIGFDPEEISKRIYRISTIDMRVDYMRPGKGTHFLSRGTVMRTGRKVAVTRMEIHNQDDVLIAVGTGAYIVG
jgi:uncharacterized protein (TIGR00369 family)